MDEPLLLTPGPITTSPETKQAMGRDWGSRDHAFIRLTRRVRDRLLDLAGGGGEYTCVLVQGSGTFVVEAALGTLVPRDGKALVLINGEYGRRIRRILEIIGRDHTTLETPEDSPNDIAALDSALASDPAITHVIAVHCETTSGILNPLEAVAEVVARRGRRLLIDAMSAFGAIPLDAKAITFEAVMASSNKCLEGVPGIGFAIVRKDALEAANGNAHSLSLDLHEQWRGFQSNGQWRFTPPTHVLAALDAALDQHQAEGGVAGRAARYAANCACLLEGMRALGFETLLAADLQAPIIVTFHMPKDPRFAFDAFYDGLRSKGFAIYPGKLTDVPSFRIGCIGRVEPADIRAALTAVESTLNEMGLTAGAGAG